MKANEKRIQEMDKWDEKSWKLHKRNERLS